MLERRSAGPRSARCGVVLAFGLILAPAAIGQIYRLQPPDTTAGNYFGTAVSIDGDRIVAGATGVDVCGANSGAAYVYEASDDGTWHLAAELRPDECAPENYFGRAVAIDGDRAVVTEFRPYFSTYRSNAVYVFDRDGEGVWEQTGRIESPGGAAEGAFAASVDLAGDRLLVTSSGNDASGRRRGAAYVFSLQGGEWVEDARLNDPGSPPDGVFGASCALDGDVAVVSSSPFSRRRDGAVHVYARTGDGRWVMKATFEGIRDFFVPMALDGGRLLVGQRDGGRDGSGLATLFTDDGPDGAWRRTGDLRPPVPYPSGGFGSGVALSADRALVVGFDEQLQFDFNIDRVVYVFAPDSTGRWTQTRLIDLGETYFGASVAADGDRAVIGAVTDERAGSVYVARIR